MYEFEQQNSGQHHEIMFSLILIYFRTDSPWYIAETGRRNWKVILNSVHKTKYFLVTE